MLPSHAVHVIEDPATAAVALHPVRQQILARLAEPDSAAGLARRLGLPRQRLNYHLRQLEAEGLVELVEERKQRNCTERMVRAVARSYVIGPSALGGVAADPASVRDHASSAYLVAVAAEVIRDVASLRDRADRAGKRLATLALRTEVRFKTAALSRSAFFEHFKRTVGMPPMDYLLGWRMAVAKDLLPPPRPRGDGGRSARRLRLGQHVQHGIQQARGSAAQPVRARGGGIETLSGLIPRLTPRLGCLSLTRRSLPPSGVESPGHRACPQCVGRVAPAPRAAHAMGVEAVVARQHPVPDVRRPTSSPAALTCSSPCGSGISEVRSRDTARPSARAASRAPRAHRPFGQRVCMPRSSRAQ